MKHLKAKEVSRIQGGIVKRVEAEDGNHYYLDYRSDKIRRTHPHVYDRNPWLISAKKVHVSITVLPKGEYIAYMRSKKHRYGK